MRRYLDIDSGRRNRFSYPKIGDFVVDVNGIYRNTPATALDPIVLSFPYETNLLSGGSTFTQIALSVAASNIVNFYRNSYIEIAGNFRLCTAYDNTVQIATVSPGFAVAYPALTPYTIRKELPVELAAGVYQEALAVNTAANIFTPGPLAAAIAGPDGLGLQDLFIFVAGAAPPLTYQFGRLNRILVAGVWSGSYQVITPNPRGVYGPLLAGTIYEIQRFSYDNVYPLNYVGTDIINNPAFEQVRLVNLVLPNNRIIGSYGGTLQSYPYLYVQIYSEKGITYQNPIISNNPGSKKALFKVPVSFLPNTTFLTLSLSSMNQQITFKENDSLRITITLPDGTILDMENPNLYTFFPGFNFPIPSDPLNQVNLICEITRDR